MRALQSRWSVIPVVCWVAASLSGCRTSTPAEPSGHDAASRTASGDAAAPDRSDASPAQPAGPPGKAVFPESEVDLGEVLQGDRVSHVFKVRNEGQGVLHIKNVRGS